MQNSNDNLEIYFKKLAEVIKKERKKLKKSQRLLADEYELQQSLISRIENYINEPKLASILTICEALGIKPSELFRKIEEKLPKNFSLIDR